VLQAFCAQDTLEPFLFSPRNGVYDPKFSGENALLWHPLKNTQLTADSHGIVVDSKRENKKVEIQRNLVEKFFEVRTGIRFVLACGMQQRFVEVNHEDRFTHWDSEAKKVSLAAYMCMDLSKLFQRMNDTVERQLVIPAKTMNVLENRFTTLLSRVSASAKNYANQSYKAHRVHHNILDSFAEIDKMYVQITTAADTDTIPALYDMYVARIWKLLDQFYVTLASQNFMTRSLKPKTVLYEFDMAYDTYYEYIGHIVKLCMFWKKLRQIHQEMPSAVGDTDWLQTMLHRSSHRHILRIVNKRIALINHQLGDNLQSRFALPTLTTREIAFKTIERD
jgi:hypothetical protein